MIVLSLLLTASLAASTPSDPDFVGQTFVAACMDGKLQIDAQRIESASWGDLSPAAQQRYAVYHFQNIFRFKADPNTFLAMYNGSPGANGFTNVCTLISGDFSLGALWTAIARAQGAKPEQTRQAPRMNFLASDAKEGYVYAGNEFDHKNTFVDVLHLNEYQLKCIRTGPSFVDSYFAFTPGAFNGERLAECP